MYSPGDVRLEDVPKPTAGPGEVLMRVAACGVCGSDLDRMYKKGPHKLPLICGHEFSAWIEELGEGVSNVQVGDLVTVPPMIPCFECSPCVQGQFSLCENYDYYGSRRDGAYAEFVVGPAALLLKVPEGLDPRAAAMVDPAAIALHAIYRTKLTVGSRVAVFGGGGPIGLFAIQWAKLMGASEIVAVDVTEEKAALAREAGATTAISDFAEMSSIARRGFDVVVETSGSPIAEDQAVSVTARQGEAVYIGIPNREVTLQTDSWNRMLRLETKLIGAWNSFSAPFPGREWEVTLEKMASGELRWEFMITHELGLDKVDETIRAMSERRIFSSKVLFVPSLGK
jgi:Threonine dehydrogenase and related Zn-dependent dehydrogenases